MVLNSFGGYNPYPNDPSERMRAAMATAPKMPTPMPDQGLFPNERAHQFAGQLLDQEIGPIANTLRSAITRAYMAGWSAALDVADSGRLANTGVGQVSEALIQKIVQDALRMAGMPPSCMQPMRQPNTLGVDQTSPLLPGWRYIMHTQGSYPCHKPAFILTRQIQDGEFADPSVFRYLSGLPIPTDAKSTCGSCLQEVHPYSNADLDWRPHIISNKLRTVAGHFVSEEEAAAGPTVDPTGIGSGDYGFPSMPDARFDVEHPNDIPDATAPGEFSAVEMQEILKLKAEADAALNNNMWLGEPNGRDTIPGS